MLGRLLPAACAGDLLRSAPSLAGSPEAVEICRFKPSGGKAPTGGGIERFGTGPELAAPAPGVRSVRMLADEGARDRLMIDGEGGGASPLIVPAVVARLLLLVPGRALKYDDSDSSCRARGVGTANALLATKLPPMLGVGVSNGVKPPALKVVQLSRPIA